MRALVVEDDAGIAAGLQASLRQAGHAVDVCPDMRQAWAALCVEPFDVVLLDLGLPDGDGNRLIAWMRVHVPEVAAVIVSSFALRKAVLRLGIGAERGLYTMRVKLFEHIHRLSLADHNDERRGALVSRVTSDIETLTMFFSWGALVWLLDGSLMFVVACVMLSYDWILALVAFAVSAPLFWVLRNLQKRLLTE